MIKPKRLKRFDDFILIGNAISREAK